MIDWLEDFKNIFELVVVSSFEDKILRVKLKWKIPVSDITVKQVRLNFRMRYFIEGESKKGI